MNRKLITILGIVFLVGIIYWLVTRSSAQKDADAQKAQELQEGLFSSTEVTNPTKITDDMTPEEKAVALAQIEAEKEAAAKLATLKAEYFTLYGSTAPANATVATLEYALKTKREFNDMVQTYVRVTGDTNTADNAFENTLDVQNAINAYEVNQTSALNAKKAAWKEMQGIAAAYAPTFIVEAKKESSWKNTDFANKIYALSDAALLWMDYQVDVYSGKVGYMYALLRLIMDWSEGRGTQWTYVIGRLQQLKSRGLTISNINEYGEII